jgi:hypothetical protein
MKASALFLILYIAALAMALFVYCHGPAHQPANTRSTFINAVKEERKKAGRDTTVDTAHFWYKNSIIYTLDMEVFQDSDGDGYNGS